MPDCVRFDDASPLARVAYPPGFVGLIIVMALYLACIGCACVYDRAARRMLARSLAAANA